MEARLPASVTTSLVLHVAGVVLWAQMSKVGPKAANRVISNVDILIHRSPAATARPEAKPSPPSLMNFLKLALPAIPKVAAPLEMKPIESIKKTLIDVPDKLDDKGRLKKLAPLAALDLGKVRTAAPQLDAGKLEAATRRSIPADMPKLEEVGSRRAPPKVLALAAALEEEDRGRLQPQGLDALSKPLKLQRAAPQVAPLLPEEAAPAPKKTVLGKMADMLTSEAQPLPIQAEAPPKALERPRPRMDALTQSLPRQEQAALGEKKKAMEIEGPLAGRAIVYYELPAFPDWLSAQGVAEAETRIKFYVNPAGDVLPDIRVETTSGYGRLDRLAIESLKRWKFASVAGASRQWGIITFRFISE